MIVLSLLAGAWFVYATDGVQYATLHILYLPIIFAALVFGAPGGVLTGACAGLLIGPYMPLDVITGEAQNLANWLYRAAFFCLIGGFVGVGVGTLRRHLATLDWLNEHDARTGLLDRTGLLNGLQHMIEQGAGREQPFLIVLQLNNFLDIQNTFGSAFAEELLKQICARGRCLLPPDVPMAVLQPDRLAVAFRSKQESWQLRVEMEVDFRAPYLVDGLPIHVDLVIGAAEFATHAHTAEELLQKASIAMHTAVKRMRPFHLYENASDLTSRDNLMLLGKIPAALTNNEFVIWHQAKVSLATGEICGTEALLRWQHPHRGMVMPGDFIPQAEKSTLVNDLTQWVIRAALADMAAWQARGHTLSVAINLSVRNLRDATLFDTLDETLALHAIDPRMVELEITESAVMDDFDFCAQLVARLCERGYRVSLDDFGVGHSSLAYLRESAGQRSQDRPEFHQGAGPRRRRPEDRAHHPRSGQGAGPGDRRRRHRGCRGDGAAARLGMRFRPGLLHPSADPLRRLPDMDGRAVAADDRLKCLSVNRPDAPRTSPRRRGSPWCGSAPCGG